MEAVESFVALALEAEDFIVTGPEKFKVKMKTKSASTLALADSRR